MISNYGAYSNETAMSLFGLSTDTKPIDKYKNTILPNGSTYYEIDTGKLFMYDAQNQQWYEQ